MRVLYLDIETSPNIADVWGLWDQNVRLSQLRESQRIIGVGYKWRGDKSATWIGEYDRATGLLSGHDAMIKAIHALYELADVVVTYNGDRFDHKHLNSEWVLAGLAPPQPYVSVDLCKVVKANFKFPSNKLAYIADRIIGDTKVAHSGHQLWRDCLDPYADPETRRKAWAVMARYCKQDVCLLEPLHEKLTPWLPAKANAALMAGPSNKIACCKCGGFDLVMRGMSYTSARAYVQYQCRSCGGWTRDRHQQWTVA